MTAHTETHQLDSELTLHDRTTTPLPIHAVTLSLTKQDKELIECRLTFQANPELYQRIDAEALFNLKPEVRNPLLAGEFLPEPDIKIETTLFCKQAVGGKCYLMTFLPTQRCITTFAVCCFAPRFAKGRKQVCGSR